MGMAAVARIDDRNPCILRRDQRSALLEMAHRYDVRKATDDAYRVGHRLALGDRRRPGVRESDDFAAQLQHRRRETEPRAGRGFVEQRRQLLALAGLAVSRAVGYDFLRQRYDLPGLFDRQVHGVYQMTHKFGVIKNEE